MTKLTIQQFSKLTGVKLSSDTVLFKTTLEAIKRLSKLDKKMSKSHIKFTYTLEEDDDNEA